MEPRSNTQVYFDPDQYPGDTLKAFEEFTKVFDLRYNAQFPDPPKTSFEAALNRWKITNTTNDVPDPKPSLQQYDEICSAWKAKDKVAKILGMFSSHKLYEDWCIAQPSQEIRDAADWKNFVDTMKGYYKPTENLTLKNFQFRNLHQLDDESFPRWCNRVESEAKHCDFKCVSPTCNADKKAIKDQIIIGTHNNDIRDEAFKKCWDLATLRTEGMQMESAARGGAEISGESTPAVNKLGKFSYTNLKDQKKTKSPQKQHRKPIECFNCGVKVSCPIYQHKEKCTAIHHKCSKCNKMGHFEKVCFSSQNVNRVNNPEDTEGTEEPIDLISLFVINSSGTRVKPKLKSRIKKDFWTQVVINNHLDSVITDTGAKVSVCGTSQAKKWGILEKLQPSSVKLKPYNSVPIPVYGVARCAVTFGTTSIPVIWHVISGNSEPVLSGVEAIQLGIIEFKDSPTVLKPIHMIKSDNRSLKGNIQSTLSKFPQNFQGLGLLRNHQVKLHVSEDVKPVREPCRPLPYHLQERGTKALTKMIHDDVIEEHPQNEPAPWISNSVLIPKDDGTVRVTMDSRNVNKAILSTNLPIPRHEDIKAKLAGAKVFSKMDFKSAFWQIELEESSRYLTVFHGGDDKLYRMKRLTMGLTPAQGELNAALKKVFGHISNVFIIHDDLVIATATNAEHEEAIAQCMISISNSGLTLNPDKCVFGMKEIHFWGMIFSADGVRPDPSKVEALEYITPPTNKTDLISFLCMMQSNAEFIMNFAQKAALLRDLTKTRVHFKWKKEHQQCFDNLINDFKKSTQLKYYNLHEKTFIFTDAHVTGLGAILAQGENKESAVPVAFASRTTNIAEKNYPQLDLEALAVDFGLRRFRKYILGAPSDITVVTDHKPLCPIFNGTRKGSIRTEKIKNNHQDVRFTVHFQRGKINQADYISRRAKPLNKVPVQEQNETKDLDNLLFLLHTTPVTDFIGLPLIAEKTKEDPTLSELTKIIQKGQSYIRNNEPNKDLIRFRQILPEICITNTGILLKEDRIILPASLQDTAIQLAHRGSHTRQSGMERRLRSHFFFHDMNSKVKLFLQTCRDCALFSDKRTKEPLDAHDVPDRCWETVAVDLFGPMPSKNHVVVVQDLSSKYPAAKLVSSTSAKKVLPALEEIYDSYGNPCNQLSDNGSPFNSSEMMKFAQERDINLQKTPPLHPVSNPAETFMRPLGKTMKIAHYHKRNEKKTLQQLLDNYRDTPHPATGISPASMLLRDGRRGTFPTVTTNDVEIQTARAGDRRAKQIRQDEINVSKFRQNTNIHIGDNVLIRNFNKSRKFDPIFSPESYEVTEIIPRKHSVIVTRKTDGKKLTRHLDDIKPFFETKPESKMPPSCNEQINIDNWHQLCEEFHNYEDDEPYDFDDNIIITGNVANEVVPELPIVEPRRSERIIEKNKRYYNDDFQVNY